MHRVGGGGGDTRQDILPGDWSCRGCSVSNFARRTECFRCGMLKDDGGGGGGNGGGGSGGYGRAAAYRDDKSPDPCRERGGGGGGGNGDGLGYGSVAYRGDAAPRSPHERGAHAAGGGNYRSQWQALRQPAVEVPSENW